MAHMFVRRSFAVISMVATVLSSTGFARAQGAFGGLTGVLETQVNSGGLPDFRRGTLQAFRKHDRPRQQEPLRCLRA